MSFYDENDDIDEVEVDDGYDSIADDLKQKAQDKALDRFEKSLNDRLNNKAGKKGSSSPTSTEGTAKATDTSGKSLERATDSISEKGINKATTDTSSKIASDSASNHRPQLVIDQGGDGLGHGGDGPKHAGDGVCLGVVALGDEVGVKAVVGHHIHPVDGADEQAEAQHQRVEEPPAAQDQKQDQIDDG